MTAAYGGVVRFATKLRIPWGESPGLVTDLTTDFADRRAAQAVIERRDSTRDPLLACAWAVFDEAHEEYIDAKPLGTTHRDDAPADWVPEAHARRNKAGLWAAIYASSVMNLIIRLCTPPGANLSTEDADAMVRAVATREFGSHALTASFASLAAPGGLIHQAAQAQGVELARWTVSHGMPFGGWMEFDIAGAGRAIRRPRTHG